MAAKNRFYLFVPFVTIFIKNNNYILPTLVSKLCNFHRNYLDVALRRKLRGDSRVFIKFGKHSTN